MFVDATATAVPGVPGGAVSAVKTYRYSKTVYQIGNRTFSSLQKFRAYSAYFSKYGGKVADAIWESGKGGVNKLAKALNSAGTGMQVHHIIPQELIEKNKMVRDAIEEGFDFNGKINGIALNTSKHSGSHPNYTSKVEELIEIANSNKTLKTAKSKMEWVANKARNLINESEGKINNIFDE